MIANEKGYGEFLSGGARMWVADIGIVDSEGGLGSSEQWCLPLSIVRRIRSGPIEN
jgi:hypothetical protein